MPANPTPVRATPRSRRSRSRRHRRRGLTAVFVIATVIYSIVAMGPPPPEPETPQRLPPIPPVVDRPSLLTADKTIPGADRSGRPLAAYLGVARPVVSMSVAIGGRVALVI